MFGLLPICAVFFVLSQLQSGLGITGQTWGIVLGLIIGGLALRSIFKYLVYRLQSTAGFEFVARERITLGDRLRNVPMGFFHDHSMGELTATMTTDLNYLENYSMHILDKVTSGVLSMVVMAICVLVFDWRIGLVFLAGILLSFPVYNYMQKEEKNCLKSGRRYSPEQSRLRWNMCRASPSSSPLICARKTSARLRRPTKRTPAPPTRWSGCLRL